MRLSKIDYEQVALNQAADPQPGTNFNTSFHTAAEAPDLAVPSEEPYAYKRCTRPPSW